MTFIEAETEIKKLVPDFRLIQFEYSKIIQREETVECVARIILAKDSPCQSFASSTWAGVINKIKIFLIPSNEEAPNE
jgi:hypothetical protein